MLHVIYQTGKAVFVYISKTEKSAEIRLTAECFEDLRGIRKIKSNTVVGVCLF